MLMLRTVEKGLDFLLNETMCNLKLHLRERKLIVEIGDSKRPLTSSSSTGAFTVVLVDGRFRSRALSRSLKRSPESPLVVILG